jgi:hypothetical protein
MRVWRGLKALGTAVLRDGVYLLPNRLALIDALQAAGDEVTASGGSAQIFAVNARDDQQEVEFRELFNRTPDYEKLVLEISGARKDVSELDKAGLSARLARLRRDLEAIALQDFFPGAARDQAREAVDASFGGLRWRDALAYIPAQISGCIAGAVLANGMFALAAISISDKHRASEAHLLAEELEGVAPAGERQRSDDLRRVHERAGIRRDVRRALAHHLGHDVPAVGLRGEAEA